MKAIMISIQPKWVAKILNGEKTIEIRKQFPKDYVGWVYIYCTKSPTILVYDVIDLNNKGFYTGLNDKDFKFQFMQLSKTEANGTYQWFAKEHCLSGKVVARFWCNKVEEHKDFSCMFPYSKLRYNKETCLSQEEIENYGFVEGKGYVPLYAIHISKLEIFDTPKELIDFMVYKHIKTFKNLSWLEKGKHLDYGIKKPLTKAFQSWGYIEV